MGLHWVVWKSDPLLGRAGVPGLLEERRRRLHLHEKNSGPRRHMWWKDKSGVFGVKRPGFKSQLDSSPPG